MPKVLRAGDAWLNSWRRAERGRARLEGEKRLIFNHSFRDLSARTKVSEDEQNLTGVLLNERRKEGARFLYEREARGKEGGSPGGQISHS